MKVKRNPGKSIPTLLLPGCKSRIFLIHSTLFHDISVLPLVLL
jgi:hypothetical protein